MTSTFVISILPNVKAHRHILPKKKKSFLLSLFFFFKCHEYLNFVEKDLSDQHPVLFFKFYP